jgi:hypothetical protein
MGMGVIARDAEGFVMASICITVPFITNLTVTEAVTLWKARNIIL